MADMTVTYWEELVGWYQQQMVVDKLYHLTSQPLYISPYFIIMSTPLSKPPEGQLISAEVISYRDGEAL